MKVGDRVRRSYDPDTILVIEGFTFKGDDDQIALLSDGTWEYTANLWPAT